MAICVCILREKAASVVCMEIKGEGEIVEGGDVADNALLPSSLLEITCQQTRESLRLRLLPLYQMERRQLHEQGRGRLVGCWRRSVTVHVFSTCLHELSAQ